VSGKHVEAARRHASDNDSPRPGRHLPRRTLAERRGLRYQTYIKMLIHEGLEREESWRARKRIHLRILYIVATITLWFVWDEAKRKSNLSKHGLDFNDAHLVYDNPGQVYLRFQPGRRTPFDGLGPGRHPTASCWR